MEQKVSGVFGRARQWLGNFKAMSGKQKVEAVKNGVLDNALYILIAVFVIAVFAYNPNFLSADSVVNILMQSASRLIMALGVAGIIVLTGTDLSAGRCLGLCACICASLLQSNAVANKMFPALGYSPWLILPALLLV
ncbi:MAG: beta-methylgalactoside transporter, partial [Clostridia bacterium]|nr:beta-methylgalactoside transporter [Clostridia bacterium]